jgi:hypothetical protein
MLRMPSQRTDDQCYYWPQSRGDAKSAVSLCVPRCCSRGPNVRAVCVLEEVRVCDRGGGLLVLFLGKLPEVLARR